MRRFLAAALAMTLAASALAAPVDLHDNAGEQVLNGILTEKTATALHA